jgi:hypothetical protein
LWFIINWHCRGYYVTRTELTLNVVTCPLGSAEPGNIWCPPLELYFPQIFRITRSVARSSRAAEVTHIGYTLDPRAASRMVAGSVTHAVDYLSAEETHSLIVRHHWSESLANAYLEAVEDLAETTESLEVLEIVGAVFTLPDGSVFTLAARPTRADWPGPMIIYVADWPHAVEAEHFEVVIGPNGKRQARDLLGHG